MSKQPHDARATLESVDEALRRSEDLHWTDPGFLEWERNQLETDRKGNVIVSRQDDYETCDYETLEVYRCYVGPSSKNSVHVQPMLWVYEDIRYSLCRFQPPEPGLPVEHDPVFGWRHPEPETVWRILQEQMHERDQDPPETNAQHHERGNQ